MKISSTSHMHCKFVLHVNMIIPASESLYAKMFSSLLVLTAKFSRHACVSWFWQLNFLDMHVFPSYPLEERGILFVFDGKETEKYFWDQTAEDEIRLPLVKSDELFLQDALICQLLYVLQILLLVIFQVFGRQWDGCVHFGLSI
jgi:hypothetical protein